MSKKLPLILGACGHLPSGAGEAEFEALYDREIKPLVQALNKFPGINMVFHYSGVILYWIERRHPEFFMLLEDLLSRKQAEFLGGGFYNPMLPLLPQADKIGQIEMLTTYLRKHFGKRPQGCWFPSIAWEQNLVGPLNSCGMNYAFLEDTQFAGAGLRPNEAGLFYPCITEDQGKLITVFPIARSLGRELRCDGAASALEKLLEKLPDGEFPLVVFPFGTESAPDKAPPLSYESFLQELADADSRVEFTTANRVFKSIKHPKRVYFPGAWANHDSVPPPRQFLTDYPEAGGIYAKMIYVHTLINNQLRGDKPRKRTALDELWKAQDSGIFSPGTDSSPGLLHSPVRKAAYRSLLEAEKITREKGKFVPSLSFFDFDLDGDGEYVFQDDKLNCYVKSRGAGIFELDYLPSAWNYLDTLSPRGSRPGTSESRGAFIDWLAPAETLAEEASPQGINAGRFCGGEEYEVCDTYRVRRSLCFKLPPAAGLPFGEIEIEKRWQLKKNALTLDYVLRNTGEKPAGFAFCPQLDLSFPGEGEAFLRVLAQREGAKEGVTLDGKAVIKSTKGLEFQDIKNETLISLDASRVFDAAIFTVRTDPGGYQSTCIMPFFAVSLEGEKIWKMSFLLKINS